MVDLKREILPGIKDRTASYSMISNKYSEIVRRYETHTVKDFRSDYTRALSESKHAKDKGFWKKLKCFFIWRSGYVVNFLPYILVLLLLSALLLIMLFDLNEEILKFLSLLPSQEEA